MNEEEARLRVKSRMDERDVYFALRKLGYTPTEVNETIRREKRHRARIETVRIEEANRLLYTMELLRKRKIT